MSPKLLAATLSYVASSSSRLPSRVNLTPISLKAVTFPDGVDAAAREEFLSDEDFAATFGMDKATFKALPKWKRTAAKKKHGLF